MKITQYTSNTFHLDDSLNLEHAIVGEFSINYSMYEKILDNKYNIVLGKLKNGEYVSLQDNLIKNVFFNSGCENSLDEINEKILKKYSGIPGFCSMDIETIDDLFNHIKRIYEISYCHYALAKFNNDRFPYFCCGYSSRNVFLNLMDIGYPNAAFLYNKMRDHAYVALPFLLRENNNKGFIIIDPTSDQLFDNKEAPRNNLFVAFGSTWVYKTDWEFGQDLYPKPEDRSRFLNLETLRNNFGDIVRESQLITEYFETVFDNPIKI